MRLGNTLKEPRPYCLPARGTMDVVGSNDLSSLLTTVRGVNPFDVSPGIQLILEKLESRPKSANPYVQYTNTLNMDKNTVGTTTDERGNTALHVAAGCGYTQIVEALLEECAAPVDAVNGDGFTPLHLAAMNGHVECVHRLCTAGANVKQLVQYGAAPGASRFLDGRTALFLAHWHQHPAVEALLRTWGAGVRRANTAGPSSLWCHAASCHDVAVFAYLFDVVDCHESAAVSPLDVPFITSALPTLLDDMPTVLSHLLPSHTQMAHEQCFIFEGLLARHIVDATCVVSTSTEGTVTVLDRILVAGHTRAFRALKLKVAECDPPLSSRVHAHADSEEGKVLLLLIQEAEARHRSLRAVDAYRKHASSRRLKLAAAAAQQSWLPLKAALEDSAVAPLP